MNSSNSTPPEPDTSEEAPTRRRQRSLRGFVLNETAVYIVVIALILGIVGFTGFQYITRTQSASARQNLDRAVSVAEAIYNQSFDGTTSFFGSVYVDPAVGTPPDNASGLAVEWNSFGENEFRAITGDSAYTDGVAVTTVSGGVTANTLQDAVLDATTGGRGVAVWVNDTDINYALISGGTPSSTIQIPRGQMAILMTSDGEKNTYCAVIVRQAIGTNGAAVTGVGYQSRKAVAPTAISGNTGVNDAEDVAWADCGFAGLTANRLAAPGIAAPADLTSLDANAATALTLAIVADGTGATAFTGLPGTHDMSASLGDPASDA